MASLNFEQAGFHYGGAPQSPQQAGQPQHQLPLHGRLSIIVSDDGRFERLVILRILKRTDHRLSGQAVADRIAARALLAFFGNFPSR